MFFLHHTNPTTPYLIRSVSNTQSIPSLPTREASNHDVEYIRSRHHNCILLNSHTDIGGFVQVSSGDETSYKASRHTFGIVRLLHLPLWGWSFDTLRRQRGLDHSPHSQRPNCDRVPDNIGIPPLIYPSFARWDGQALSRGRGLEKYIRILVPAND